MLITCPTCASSYRIDASKIGPEGRSVRCAACRETWFLPPGAAEETEEAPAFDAMAEVPDDPIADAAWAEATASVRETAEPDLDAEAAPKGPRKRLRLGAAKRKAAGSGSPTARSRFPIGPTALFGLAALAIVPVSCLARNGVAGLVPQTASVFNAVGLPVNRRGLEFRDVVAVQNPADEDKPAELVVEGDLVGIAHAGVPVPEIAVEIVDAAGKTVRTFSASAPRPSLAAGETARFRARLADPPAAGRTVELRFAAAH